MIIEIPKWTNAKNEVRESWLQVQFLVTDNE